MAAKVKEKPLVEEERVDDVSEEELESNKKQKKEKKKKEKKAKAKSGMGIKIFVIIFALLIIGALVGILGFNLFNVRDKYLASTLQNIPIIKNLVEIPETNDAPELTQEELTAKINDLERKLETSEKRLFDSEKNLELKQAEIDRLKIFEQQQTQFKADKEALDEQVALNNPKAFSDYYEKISPENAEKLYPQTKAEAEKQKEISQYLASINETDESSAAKILEQLIPSDLDLVVAILKSINSKLSGAIISEMSPENGAAVYKRWSPLTY